ncbi:uncharacterized protein LOC114520163 [Dendronephthya gigantea]|uniref:uncharacterized protein LOC114520163 n=1 Tax=Dendronephthya gigantea TaxID=151771 RepID=UPI00106ACFF9|nr:uncharacterized protein LOC114520163 [Dendronephthya gigantea]
MTDIGACGAGGWTLAMKLNGTKNTFTYDSPLWTNNETYAIQDGLEGLTEKESKLASYWNTPFTKICMGMSYNGTRKWMTFNYAASSLYSVIADGQFRPTTAGRAAWKSLIVESSLQYNCNREGFNVRFNGESAMRIGIVSNNERDCASCDSWIGISRGSFTTDGTWHSRMVCGNHASHHSHDNGIKNSVTFGYIFVQREIVMHATMKTCLLFFILESVALSESTNEAVFRRRVETYLPNCVFRTKRARSESECSIYCLRHSSCFSANYKFTSPTDGICELNSKTIKDLPNEDKHNPDYVYLEKVWSNEENEFSPDTKEQASSPSCKELFLKHESLPDGVHTLQQNSSSAPYKAYCHMTDIPGCGGGGWTLVIKLDGNKDTFTYNSQLWTNKETYGIQDGLEGLAKKESKLDSYWKTPLTKVCLGMSYNGNRKWMSFNYTANSLYSAIADGTFRATTAGRAAWKSLVTDSSLQRNCNREGFNVFSRMRIGLFANQENDCHSCDSWIGFGTLISGKTCANYAFNHSPDNGNKDLVTFGYILVQ